MLRKIKNWVADSKGNVAMEDSVDEYMITDGREIYDEWDLVRERDDMLASKYPTYKTVKDYMYGKSFTVFNRTGFLHNLVAHLPLSYYNSSQNELIGLDPSKVMSDEKSPSKFMDMTNLLKSGLIEDVYNHFLQEGHFDRIIYGLGAVDCETQVDMWVAPIIIRYLDSRDQEFGTGEGKIPEAPWSQVLRGENWRLPYKMGIWNKKGYQDHWYYSDLVSKAIDFAIRAASKEDPKHFNTRFPRMWQALDAYLGFTSVVGLS